MEIADIPDCPLTSGKASWEKMPSARAGGFAEDVGKHKSTISAHRLPGHSDHDSDTEGAVPRKGMVLGD